MTAQQYYDVTDEKAQARELIRLRAQIAELKLAEKFLADLIKDGGPRSFDVDKHRLTVTACTSKTVETVDWKTVAEKAGASRQLITAHTKRTQRVTESSLRIFGRKATS